MMEKRASARLTVTDSPLAGGALGQVSGAGVMGLMHSLNRWSERNLGLGMGTQRRILLSPSVLISSVGMVLLTERGVLPSRDVAGLGACWKDVS